MGVPFLALPLDTIFAGTQVLLPDIGRNHVAHVTKYKQIFCSVLTKNHLQANGFALRILERSLNPVLVLL